LRKPIGAWVHLETGGDIAAFDLGRKLEPIIPHVRVTPARGGLWRLLAVQPLRMRPGIVISQGELRSGRPDLVLTASDSSGVALQLVTGLDELIGRRWFELSWS
jgi:hypothetical protein